MVLFFPLSYQFYHEVFEHDHHECHSLECVENRDFSNSEKQFSHPHDLCLVSHFEYVNTYQNNQTIQIDAGFYSLIPHVEYRKEQAFSSVVLFQQLRAPPFCA